MADYQEIEALFSQLLSEDSSSLSESEIAEVREFVDVGEYGLALETRVDIHHEENKAITPSAVALVHRLALTMSVDTAPLLQLLPQGD